MQFLFFDDKNIMSRSGVTRKLGTPEIIAQYNDPYASTSTGLPSVWYDEENKKYHMFYNGNVGDYTIALHAISEDGINYRPCENPKRHSWKYCLAPHQMFDPEMYGDGGELAYVYFDRTAPRQERLKALYTRGDANAVRIMHNYLYTSEDGFDWKLQPQEWHNLAAEPCATCFYNNVTGKHTIVARPDAGVRRVGIIETDDFKSFSDLKLVMTPDSLDEPLAEHYGMPVFPYGDIFVGFLYIYHAPNVRLRKYLGGKMDAELVYSYNGSSFNRTLREPLFLNDTPETAGMTFPSDMYYGKNGELLVCASANPKEHGYFKGNGNIVIYRLRKDGFISFHTDADGEVLTLPMLYHGGDITVNIKCESFSCALYTDDSINEPMRWQGYDLLPIDGYSHEEFNTFSGDETDHKLTWKSAELEALKGKIIYFEIRIKNGDLYSLNGDLTPMQIIDLARYHMHGVMPDLKGIG